MPVETALAAVKSAMTGPGAELMEVPSTVRVALAGHLQSATAGHFLADFLELLRVEDARRQGKQLGVFQRNLLHPLTFFASPEGGHLYGKESRNVVPSEGTNVSAAR